MYLNVLVHMAKYNVFDTVFVTYLRSCQIHVYLRRISHGKYGLYFKTGLSVRYIQIQANTHCIRSVRKYTQIHTTLEGDSDEDEDEDM